MYETMKKIRKSVRNRPGADTTNNNLDNITQLIKNRWQTAWRISQITTTDCDYTQTITTMAQRHERRRTSHGRSADTQLDIRTLFLYCDEEELTYNVIKKNTWETQKTCTHQTFSKSIYPAPRKFVTINANKNKFNRNI